MKFELKQLKKITIMIKQEVLKYLLRSAMICFVACSGAPGYTTAGESLIAIESTHSMDKADGFWTVSPVFGDDNLRDLSYTWNSSDKTVATIEMNADKSATVTPLSAGTTAITIQCDTDSKLFAYCFLTVTAQQEPDPEPKPEPDDGVTRILCIGNSFSADAVEQYLWELSDAAGIEVVIGNMYIGGSALSQHLGNALNDTPSYSYRKIGQNGVKTTTANQRLSMAITDEDWDYISFQEQSGLSGLYQPWAASLPRLLEYVNGLVTNDDVQMVIHRTWAFPQSSTYSGFANYGNDQMTMFNALVEATNQVAELTNIDIIVPVGTAIQNGRTSWLGDTFNRDDRHLELTYGRYTAACTWFEKIFGEDVTDNPYFPVTIDALKAEIAQNAAHAAVLIPDAVTDMVNYKIKPD